MQPTVEQLKALYQRSVMASNLLQPINLVRFDNRTNNIVMLIGETIQLEILENGEVVIE